MSDECRGRSTLFSTLDTRPSTLILFRISCFGFQIFIESRTMSAVPLTAAEAGLVSCEMCRLLSRPADPTEPGYCPRCGAELVSRRYHSIQYTWALVIAAAICYIPANVLPVLNTTTLGSTDSDTI